MVEEQAAEQKIPKESQDARVTLSESKVEIQAQAPVPVTTTTTKEVKSATEATPPVKEAPSAGSNIKEAKADVKSATEVRPTVKKAPSAGRNVKDAKEEEDPLKIKRKQVRMRVRKNPATTEMGRSSPSTWKASSSKSKWGWLEPVNQPPSESGSPTLQSDESAGDAQTTSME